MDVDYAASEAQKCGIEGWSFDFLWSLDVGAWCFAALNPTATSG